MFFYFFKKKNKFKNFLIYSKKKAFFYEKKYCLQLIKPKEYTIHLNIAFKKKQFFLQKM